MDRHFQVFVSSTFQDLQAERARALKELIRMGHLPAGMELFPGINDDIWETVTAEIDRSDYYVLIVGSRYGSIDDEGTSWTEREFEYARDRGLPILALVKNGSHVDGPLLRFLEIVKGKGGAVRGYQPFDDENDFATSLVHGITSLIRKHDRPGWIRGSSASSFSAIGVRDHHIEVFRVNKQAVEHRWLIEGQRWTKWLPMDPAAPSPVVEVAACSRGTYVDLFAASVDNTIHHRWWGRDEGWSPWDRDWLGGRGPMSVASLNDDHLELFFTRADGTLAHTWYRDGWSRPASF